MVYSGIHTTVHMETLSISVTSAEVPQPLGLESTNKGDIKLSNNVKKHLPVDTNVWYTTPVLSNRYILMDDL